MRVLAAFALLAAPALAFMPPAPRAAARAGRVVLRMAGEYSEKVRLSVSTLILWFVRSAALRAGVRFGVACKVGAAADPS
jgi:hypothetical protein